MNLDTFNKLINLNTKQDIETEVNVYIHLGNGLVLSVDNVGTDGQGAIYLDCDAKNFLKF